MNAGSLIQAERNEKANLKKNTKENDAREEYIGFVTI